MNDQEALHIAFEEAKSGYEEGGVPVRYPTFLLNVLQLGFESVIVKTASCFLMLFRGSIRRGVER